MAIPKLTDGAGERGLMVRLGRDKSGNTLALATAGIVALMGMIGGAVDMSRSYMVQSRLQQACDAGALSARKAMEGESLTQANKDVGNRFFDFNFPQGTLGATLVSRAYTQPTSTQGTPQAIVNGTIIATVPTTIMRAFGNETIDLTIRCSSKMEIQSADVAMVLDVTGSMGSSMRIRTGSWATETRMAALRKAVRAFYNALGPGRAGGDLSKGRIRYAFVPYNTVINTGYLLTHAQMVDDWTYQSREAVTNTVYGWRLGNESSVNWGSGWSAAPNNLTSASAYNGWTDYNSSNSDVRINGTYYNRRENRSESSCNSLNTMGPSGNKILDYVDNGDQKSQSLQNTTNDPPVYVGPNNPSQQVLSYTQGDEHEVQAFRYRYVSGQSGSSRCRLQYSDEREYTRTRSGTSTKPIYWDAYSGTNYIYAPRTIDVSGLKALLGGWNSSVTVPALNRTGGSTQTYYNVKLSGSSTGQTVYTGGGSAESATVPWRGCVEERTTINTINGSTALDPIPTGVIDLDTTILASTGNDNTRWRPWLPSTVFNPNNGNNFDDDGCPAPALKLQEIADYDTTVFETPYPNLFRDTSGAPTSIYYPFQSGGSNAWRNVQTIRNYIDRMPYAGGTMHDSGFIWGLHLVSGEGMFAGENPDRFNGQAVSRNIVFMTDGKIEPPSNSYVFSGYNRYDQRISATTDSQSDLIPIHNRRLRILCEAAKRQGITVWVVVVSDSVAQDFDDLRACASSSGTFKSAATSDELIQSFTTIAQSIGGLRISQ